MKQDFRKPTAIAIAASIPQEQHENGSNQSFLAKILIARSPLRSIYRCLRSPILLKPLKQLKLRLNQVHQT
jgi:hypothetical protein